MRRRAISCPSIQLGPVLGGLCFAQSSMRSPEGFGVFFVVGGSVGADEGVGEGEAVGFPDEFDVVWSES